MKPTTENRNTRLAADLPGQPAAERRHDGGGDDVGGQHPGHLVLRADSEPWMRGSATLAIVLSSACMIEASITDR